MGLLWSLKHNLPSHSEIHASLVTFGGGATKENGGGGEVSFQVMGSTPVWKKKHRIFDIKDYLSGGDPTSQSTKSSFLDKTGETHLDVRLKEEGTRAARSTEMAGSGGKPIKAQLPWQGVEANVTTREL